MTGLAPSTKPFNRHGNEGYFRKTPPTPGFVYKRDKKPPHNADCLCRAGITQELREKIIAEKDALNISMSTLVSNIISNHFQLPAPSKTRPPEKAALGYFSNFNPNNANNYRVVTYISPQLKLKVIEESRRQHISISSLVRQILTGYFFNKCLNKQMPQFQDAT